MCNSCDMSLQGEGKILFILSKINLTDEAQASILGQEGAWGPTMMHACYQPWIGDNLRKEGY